MPELWELSAEEVARLHLYCRRLLRHLRRYDDRLRVLDATYGLLPLRM